jgi:sialic acid synthase
MTIFDRNILEEAPFFIAEVGQNHQGDFELAKEYIIEFSRLGASAVKFQMRNNKLLFSASNYKKVYNSKNAFGVSYGEHREALELTPSQFYDLKEVAQKHGCFFMVTPFDEYSLDQLVEMDIDIFKIASFDLGNLPFIEKICKANKPTVLSVGGGNIFQIRSSVEILSKLSDYAVLHCVSHYPCPAEKLNLQQITVLGEEFPTSVVGLSDHYSGISTGPVAYMLGARVFEKHVTFSRAWKGSDHAFSLMPEGFRKFVRDVVRTPMMLRADNSGELGKEEVFQKLGKKIMVNSEIKQGQIITGADLSFSITDEVGISVRDCNKIIGRKAKISLSKGTMLRLDTIE